MAKTVIVGEGGARIHNRYCPQCRRLLMPERILANGVNCPRCGFFTWADYKKYPRFADIPNPEEFAEPEDFSKTQAKVKPGEEIKTVPPRTTKAKTTSKKPTKKVATTKKQNVELVDSNSPYAEIFNPYDGSPRTDEPPKINESEEGE